MNRPGRIQAPFESPGVLGSGFPGRFEAGFASLAPLLGRATAGAAETSAEERPVLGSGSLSLSVSLLVKSSARAVSTELRVGAVRAAPDAHACSSPSPCPSPRQAVLYVARVAAGFL